MSCRSRPVGERGSVIGRRLAYYRRVFSAYGPVGRSQLTFWHETPEANPHATTDRLGPYYMTFSAKAGYAGPFDNAGVPLLDYRGSLGKQYNPIAIAQYGLARYNQYAGTQDQSHRHAFLAQADWLVANLRENQQGVPVWSHDFDWEYRETLKAPWHSGLAQGQGISLLVRAHAETGDAAYAEAAGAALASIQVDVRDGGVRFTDGNGRAWLEEYVVDPPSHILNGFIWGLWGIRDYALARQDREAGELFGDFVQTLIANLDRYDTGFWSLYELRAPGSMRMLASPYYHRLHIVQMKVMYEMTGEDVFREYGEQWENYESSSVRRFASLAHKAAFKLLHY